MGQPCGVHETVGEVTRRYLALADAALPGRVEGLYLVGSVAFDDFRPGLSGVDFLAVSATPLGPDEVLALGEVHADLREACPAPPFEGAYVSWAELAADPTARDDVPHHQAGQVATGLADDAGADPLRWLTLRTRPVAVRGPERPTVWADDAVLRRWVLASLNDRWADWVGRLDTLVNRGTMQLPDWAVAQGVLGMPRLHRILATGGLASTTDAGAYALATFDAEWAPIVTEALNIRLGGERSEEYVRRPLARRRDALAFMEHVIDDANARYGLPASSPPGAAPVPGAAVPPGGAAPPGAVPPAPPATSPLDVAAPLAPPPPDGAAEAAPRPSGTSAGPSPA